MKVGYPSSQVQLPTRIQVQAPIRKPSSLHSGSRSLVQPQVRIGKASTEISKLTGTADAYQHAVSCILSIGLIRIHVSIF
ncbi:hypothetical protein CY35_12G068500 [Sphagnum magellanicum]|nr:hypothetical protein CY35_12G068500 [Sphagnum magellanicum]